MVARPILSDWARRTRSASVQPSAVIVTDPASVAGNVATVNRSAVCEIAIDNPLASTRYAFGAYGGPGLVWTENQEPSVALAPSVAHNLYCPGKNARPTSPASAKAIV